MALAGCARDAPRLPSGSLVQPAPAVSAEERSAQCAKLGEDIATLRSEMATIEQVIKGKRRKDQVQGYLAAVLFPPMAIAIDQQRASKTALDERQTKIDVALAQQHALGCPAT